MSNEIQAGQASGLTLYALVRNAALQVWNTSLVAFEAYNASHYASYVLALAEQGATGWYSGAFPPGITAAGRYGLDVRQQAGGSPAVSDQVVATGSLIWNGSQEVTLDLTQPIPSSNTQGSVGDALLAAEAQGFGKWVLSPGANTLTVYRHDNTTVARIFALDNSAAPTQRS